MSQPMATLLFFSLRITVDSRFFIPDPLAHDRVGLAGGNPSDACASGRRGSLVSKSSRPLQLVAGRRGPDVYTAAAIDRARRRAADLLRQLSRHRWRYRGAVKTGTGVVTRKGSVFTLVHNTADRRARATADSSIGRGSASLQSPPGSVYCSITDRNIRDNSCGCGGS